MILMAGARYRKYRDDEDGGIIVFVVMLFLIMVVAGGMAVDFMRQETARADLQNALDRGVLAAAAINQTAVVDGNGDDDLDEEYTAFVGEYMQSRSFKAASLTLSVDHTETATSKTIEADAKYDLNTFFLRIIGIDTIPVPAKAYAQQARQDVEVSLVLDVSGSMTNNNVTVNGTTYTRLERAKIDAKAFVTYLLGEDETGEKTTFSIVPYSAKVAPSKNLADQFNLQPVPNTPQKHTRSYCFDFLPEDYKSSAIKTTTAYNQFPHFRDGTGRWGCPRAENQIVPITNVEKTLHDAIQGLTTENWTAVYEGVKWGAALLDPEMRPAISTLATLGDVPSKFSSLPRDHSADNTVKALVVMSDGRNTIQPTMRNDEYVGPEGDFRGAEYWHDKWSESSYGNSSNPNCNRSGSTPRVPEISHHCDLTSGLNGSGYGVGTNDLSITTLNEWENSDGSFSTVNEPDALLFEICDRAKEQGIVIYTIGFELTASSTGGRALKECASGLDKFYPVNGLNLSEAFEAIAADISNLKLKYKQQEGS